MSGSARRDTLTLALEAAEWLDALESGDARRNAAFVAWLQASPRHLEEFLLLTASEEACVDIDAQRRIDVEEMIAGIRDNVVPLQDGAVRAAQAGVPSRRFLSGGRPLHWAAGIAVLVAGVALTMGWRTDFGRWQSYATATGEQRAIELDDGSLVHLNTRSRAEVRLSAGRRDVRLLKGEALFKVAQEAARPFQVHTGDAVIRAIGTQFNVSLGSEVTMVSVIEGKVQLSNDAEAGPFAPQLLTAGEQARIVANGQITRGSANLAQVNAWRQRRLVFRDSTLAEIAAEFNRYNRTPQIVVQGDLRTRRYGGTFDADDPQALASFLRPEQDLVCELRGSTLVIRPSQAGER
jgi:transmembrane sensor